MNLIILFKYTFLYENYLCIYPKTLSSNYCALILYNIVNTVICNNISLSA